MLQVLPVILQRFSASYLETVVKSYSTTSSIIGCINDHTYRQVPIHSFPARLQLSRGHAAKSCALLRRNSSCGEPGAHSWALHI